MRSILIVLSVLITSASSIAQTAAFKEVRKLAKKGDPAAQYELGVYYLYKYDEAEILQSFDEGDKWLRRSAEQNYEPAILKLAVFYSLNSKRAADDRCLWFEKAYNLGDTTMSLALFYEHNFITKDAIKAFEWCKKYVDHYGCVYYQGGGNSCYRLALLYYYGKGTVANNDLAFKYMTRSHEGKYNPGTLNLGIYYGNGIGVEKDEERALELIKQAANNGYDVAEYYLGTLYLEGVLVDKDQEEALIWLRKAANQENEKAKELLKTL